MSISIELKPEIEELLEQEAAAKGVSVESYVEELIEQQVFQPHKTSHIGSKKLIMSWTLWPKGQTTGQHFNPKPTRARAFIRTITDNLPRRHKRPAQASTAQ
ncbi:MAG TPA: hypothetical protein VE732_05130 [Nitrososphaera sp.]|nr:hypothetical protein [Nitrososphaera sp.]